MPVRTRTFPALALSALALAACGDSGPAVTEHSGRFTVTLDEYLMRPQKIHVPHGAPLTVTVVNHGRLGHTFRIRTRNHTVLKLTTIAPGRRQSRSFRLAPGTYRMFCALANHEELGMYGTLVVG